MGGGVIECWWVRERHTHRHTDTERDRETKRQRDRDRVNVFAIVVANIMRKVAAMFLPHG